MQPQPSQLPRDDAHRPVSRNLKKGALWLLLLGVVSAALLAFLLPHRQTEAQRAGDSATPPTTRQQRTAAEGYHNPTH